MTALHRVSPPLSEAKILKEEPTWKNTGATFAYTRELMRGINWHNSVADIKNFRKYIEEWIRATHSNFKVELKKFKDIPDKEINASLAILMRMQLQGFPVSEHHRDMIEDYYERLRSYTPPAKESRKTNDSLDKKRLTVQDHINAQIDALRGDFLDVVSGLLDGSSTGKEFEEKIHTSSLKSPHFVAIGKLVQRYYDELSAALNKTDEQLVEGYSWVSRKSLKHATERLASINTTVQARIAATRIRRVVSKKPTDKKKMASKLRFVTTATIDGLVMEGLAPVDIIGATSAWVYDTKTRKIVYFESNVTHGLFAQGPMIRGFNSTGQKILRSPKDQLPEFNKLRKHEKRKEWLDALTTKTSNDHTGRTVPSMILLKVEK